MASGVIVPGGLESELEVSASEDSVPVFYPFPDVVQGEASGGALVSVFVKESMFPVKERESSENAAPVPRVGSLGACECCC